MRPGGGVRCGAVGDARLVNLPLVAAGPLVLDVPVDQLEFVFPGEIDQALDAPGERIEVVYCGLRHADPRQRAALLVVGARDGCESLPAKQLDRFLDVRLLQRREHVIPQRRPGQVDLVLAAHCVVELDRFPYDVFHGFDSGKKLLRAA